MRDEKTAEKMRPTEAAAKPYFSKNEVPKAAPIADAELRSFLHDLRSAAGAISAASELLAATSLAQPQRELVDTVRFGAENIGALADGVAFLEKEKDAKTGKRAEPMDAPFDLLELFDSFQKSFQARAQGRPIRVEAEANLPENERFFAGDQLALRKILMNLLENALQFTEKGTIRLSVRRDATIAVGQPAMLLFEVTDTGSGIAPTDLLRIFEPYFQGKNAPKGQGRGLGLAIVRELAERSGGSASAQSKPGQGARLQVRLPMEAADGPASDHFSAKKSERTTALRRSTVVGKTVLAIDDDALSRRLLGQMFENWGCRFVLASSAGKGLALAESHRFDLIFLDANLPDSDGASLARAIRTGPASLNHHAPLLGLSGFEADETSRAAFDLFLEKPAPPAIVLAAMHFLLTQKPRAGAQSDLAAVPAAEPFALDSEPDEAPDFAYLLEFCGQNGLFAAEMMSLFLKDAPERAAFLLAAAEKKDFAEARKWSHALKSDFFLMGLGSLRQFALDLEAEAKSAEPDAGQVLFLARNLSDRLRRSMGQIVAARAEFLSAAAG